MRRNVLAIAAAAAATAAWGATTKTTSTRTATAPAATRPAADPAVVKILDGLEAAGEKHQTIEADLVWIVENPILGDKETRTGSVKYQRGAKGTWAKVRIHLDTCRLGDGPKYTDRRDYVFDGEWVTVAEHRTKKMTRYQVVPPGEKLRVLKLGQGPLPPLPFGQKTDEVLKYFSAETRPTKPSEPKNTVYLKLTRRIEHREELNFRWLEMWIDPTTHLPVKIHGKEQNKSLQTIRLTDVKLNRKLKKEVFDLPRPLGWRVEITPYEKPPAADR